MGILDVSNEETQIYNDYFRGVAESVESLTVGIMPGRARRAPWLRLQRMKKLRNLDLTYVSGMKPLFFPFEPKDFPLLTKVTSTLPTLVKVFTEGVTFPSVTHFYIQSKNEVDCKKSDATVEAQVEHLRQLSLVFPKLKTLSYGKGVLDQFLIEEEGLLGVFSNFPGLELEDLRLMLKGKEAHERNLNSILAGVPEEREGMLGPVMAQKNSPDFGSNILPILFAPPLQPSLRDMRGRYVM